MKISFRLAAVAAATVSVLAGTWPGGVAAASTPGQLLWQAGYHGRFSGAAGGNADVVSPDGTKVFVAGYLGYTSQEGSKRGLIVAYDATSGKQLWLRSHLGTSFSGGAVNTSVTVSPDSSTVFAGGLVSDRSGNKDFAVTKVSEVAYDAATGTRRWQQELPKVGTVLASGVSADGTTLYLMTSSYQSVALDAATGKIRWTSPATGLGRDPFGENGAMSPDGSQVAVTGLFLDGGSEEYETVDVDAATGATKWIARYTKAGSAPPSATFSPDGSQLFVTGPNATIDYRTSTGKARWAESARTGTRSAVSPDGSQLFIAGTGGSSQVVVQALAAATGALRWKTTGSPAAEVPAAVAVTPDGSAVIVNGPASTSANVLAYRAATGARLWAGSYESNDAAAMAMSPDGSQVVVTGNTGLPSGEAFTAAFAVG